MRSMAVLVRLFKRTQRAPSPLPYCGVAGETADQRADDQPGCLSYDAAPPGAGRVADQAFTALLPGGGHYGFARAENRVGGRADFSRSRRPAHHTAL